MTVVYFSETSQINTCLFISDVWSAQTAGPHAAVIQDIRAIDVTDANPTASASTAEPVTWPSPSFSARLVSIRDKLLW